VTEAREGTAATGGAPGSRGRRAARGHGGRVPVCLSPPRDRRQKGVLGRGGGSSPPRSAARGAPLSPPACFLTGLLSLGYGLVARNRDLLGRPSRSRPRPERSSSQTRRVDGNWPARARGFITPGTGAARHSRHHHGDRVAAGQAVGARGSHATGGRRPGRALPHPPRRGDVAHDPGEPLSQGYSEALAGPLPEPLVAVRNLESLRRLRRMAEQRAGQP
jgi:hypothetical protein